MKAKKKSQKFSCAQNGRKFTFSRSCRSVRKEFDYLQCESLLRVVTFKQMNLFLGRVKAGLSFKSNPFDKGSKYIQVIAISLPN